MEKKRLIIALSGKKRSGKDTVADYLVERFGFVKYGFADPIKEIGKIMFDFSEEQLNTDKKEEIDKRWGISPRQFTRDLELIMDSSYFLNIFLKYLKI